MENNKEVHKRDGRARGAIASVKGSPREWTKTKRTSEMGLHARLDLLDVPNALLLQPLANLRNAVAVES